MSAQDHDSDGLTSPLRLDDAREIIRLLGEIAVVEGSVQDKKRALMTGLCKLVNAQAWIWIQSRVTPPNQVDPFAILDGGWANDDQRSKTFIAAASKPPTDPPLHALMDQLPVTRTRPQLVPDAKWFGTEFHERWRKPTGLDDILFSIHPLGKDNLISAIGLHRATEAGAFTDRDRMIAHLILTEIPWLHRADAIPEAAYEVSGLSPRMQQVLIFLLSGDSRKQIAIRLGISEHTVSDHIKALHRHFGVSSRGELMSKFLVGGGKIP